MIDALDICRPRDVVGIERAGDREFEMRRLPRRLDQEALERRLAVRAVGAEVAQIPPRLEVHRRVGLRGGPAKKRAGIPRAAAGAGRAPRRTAGGGEREKVSPGQGPGEGFQGAAVLPWG